VKTVIVLEPKNRQIGKMLIFTTFGLNSSCFPNRLVLCIFYEPSSIEKKMNVLNVPNIGAKDCVQTIDCANDVN
jgi:hypothetical protein